MPNQKNQPAVHVASPTAAYATPRTPSVRRHLPTIIRCIVIVPLTMALLGAEIELRISPQLDLFLTAAGVWGMWTWLRK